MINSSEIRDSKVIGLNISNDWEQGLHSVELVLLDTDKQERRYKLSGVTMYSIYEDFGCEDIAQVKLLNIESKIFLSLDPYDELSNVPDYENDCFWFEALSLERIVR
ncbi:hypothetical protein [Vibrio parahaemolyticus]|uniref:hypothetical protein n=1 Tax=Vibrio parahaemolyticus TaxID=670 RepID=UPI001E4738B6|nr:hypothetical protein [Vibrio parahaemolyticus]ELB2137397.1 hypothetical protein [Vibrio parahaemolyticus]MCQ9048855.1 hypothetical protein [Vibrio parahaemolyticus]